MRQRILAIDYGTKRTGIAVTDETQTFAFGLATVATREVFRFLSEYVAGHPVEGFVVGEPKRMNNTATDATIHVEAFVKKLKKEFPALEVYRMDERFTSAMAKQSIIDSGAKKKMREDKSLVDMVSATIILQSWIEWKRVASGE
jgi:putative Holliday junction resolvase